MASRVVTERTAVSASDFESEIFRLSAESESYNFLIHGDANSGKTTTAATVPGRSMWFVLEPGYKVAVRRGATGHGRVVNNAATAWAAVDWLTEDSPKTKQPRYESLDWLVIDGMTTMQDRIRLSYTQEAFDNSNGTKRAHRNLPDKPDYFNTQNFLKTWIGTLVDLPVNLLITAHSYRTEGEDGELIVFPGFQGKITETSNAISGLMDVTGYMERRRVSVRGQEGSTKEVHRLWFKSPERRSAKEADVRYIVGDKFNKLGRFMDSPSIPRMLEKINSRED